MTSIHDDPKSFLRFIFDRGLKEVTKEENILKHLPAPPKGRTIIFALGKGASAMAKAVAEYWAGPYRGLIVTAYGHHQPTKTLEHFEVIEAGHPVPDDNSIIAARRILELVEDLNQDDLLIALISGGGSSLLSLPCDGVSLIEKQDLTRDLLSVGATIGDINCIRKHLSKIKGGRLAQAAAPAKVVSLMVSDVVGNYPDLIASGSTVEDRSTGQEARHILKKYNMSVSENIWAALNCPQNETPDLSGADYYSHQCHIVTSAKTALMAAEKASKKRGYHTTILGDDIEGEAQDIAQQHAALITEMKASEKPVVLLSGGELTVTHYNKTGKGGPNTEYILALAIALKGRQGVYALACDTDGKDGSGGNAGAIIGPDILGLAQEAGISADHYLDHHDSYSFFQRVGGLITTGPTQTNVNDFRAIMIINSENL